MTTNNAVNVGLSGATGTGNFVGSASPTLSGTATFGNLKAASNGSLILDNTSANLIQLLTGGGTCVNYISIASAATAVAPFIAAGGTDTNIVLQLNGKGTGGIATQGTTAGGTATSGYVGELISSAYASAVAITSGALTNIQSLTLTPGDWDVWAAFGTAPAAGTVQSTIIYALNLANNNLPAPSSVATSNIVQIYTTFAASQPYYGLTGIYPISVSANTSIYLNAVVVYSVSTLTAQGIIMARRRR